MFLLDSLPVPSDEEIATLSSPFVPNSETSSSSSHANATPETTPITTSSSSDSAASPSESIMTRRGTRIQTKISGGYVFSGDGTGSPLNESTPSSPSEEKMCQLLKQPNVHSITAIMASPSGVSFTGNRPPSNWRKGCSFNDVGLLIFTSGTTGLPKAARLPHSRIFGSGYLVGYRFGLLDGDVIYNVLPMYHSSGGVLAVSMALTAGGSVAVRKKFSARAFWPDCARYNATVVVYIGELCRYLLQTPPSPSDSEHKVRLAVGNGLRPEIWAEFQQRFNVPHIGEFYGSTEGNAGLFNLCKDASAQGAIGHMGTFVEYMSNMRLIKLGEDGEPIRDTKGRCIEVPLGEPGELIAKIITWDPIRSFSGYHGNKSGTEKKKIFDAFSKGDEYFRTGDLLKKDAKGHWYFVDRIGDTFRWKGENVSTAEVAQVLAKFPGGAMNECNVYGVQVPSHEGRACAVAIAKNDKNPIDFDAFAQYALNALPAYAVPVFVRVLNKGMETTTTFKMVKSDLQKQGVNPGDISEDDVYVLLGKKYVKLTPAIWNDIVGLKAKL